MSFFVSLLISLTLGLSSAIAGSSQRVPLDSITTRPLNENDKGWFIKEFPRSFMSVYIDKTFVVTKDKTPKILGPKDEKEKQAWLLETAIEEFQDFVRSPKKGNFGILVLQDGRPVGALLYTLREVEKILYLAQYFILPEHQKKGIGHYVIHTLLPKSHPAYERYEILARHQNDAAFLLYRGLGFSIGDISIVQKYEYDPLRYMSFYKLLA